MERRRDKEMRTTLKGAFITMLLVALSHAAVAAIDDKVVRFSTDGYDCYADGMPVADGECYALVWSPKGKSFSGFNADGTAASQSDRVVLVGALAENGKCRDSVFQVPAEEYDELKSGNWAVCLVDTRTADGVPAGVGDGSRPLRVNRWGIVSGGVEVADAGSARLSLASGVRRAAKAAPAFGACADTPSAVPPTLMPPRITAMDVSEGVVRLAVSDTVPYLTYTVSSSSTPAPGGFSLDKYADRVDGADDSKGEIVIETDAHGGSRFFKITRVE